MTSPQKILSIAALLSALLLSGCNLTSDIEIESQQASQQTTDVLTTSADPTPSSADLTEPQPTVPDTETTSSSPQVPESDASMDVIDPEVPESDVVLDTAPDGRDFWTDTAVRKVLQTFAFGGFPGDSQITQWAAMRSEDAIREMLTFEPVNTKLSPAGEDRIAEKIAAYIPQGGGQLEGIARYFSENPDQLLDSQDRSNQFDPLQWDSAVNSWDMAIRARGLNTFYHRIGFWETNYHMVANQSAGVFPYPILRHYDNVMNKHSDNGSYDQVLAQGALNAAIAYQYGHNSNSWDASNNTFYGNEDFAREFHQLLFGILGSATVGGDAYQQNHELVTIKNTAKALTGLNAYYHDNDQGGPDIEIEFDAEIAKHHQADLTILDQQISGYSAREKISQLASVAINHVESLNNLPVLMVAGLADDKLTAEKMAAIRALWKQLPQKNMLEFIRAYAISPMFHSSGRVKYHTSFERKLLIHNNMQLSNEELYTGPGMNPVHWLLSEDSVKVFNPVHNVFGHQRGSEAINSPEVFKNAYNTSTENIWYYLRGTNADDMRKEWQTMIPKNAAGQWLVKDVSRWLWQRFVADGLKNFGTLEKAHLYALLGSDSEDDSIHGMDLGFYLDEENPTRVYSAADLEGDRYSPVVEALGDQVLDLDAVDVLLRSVENRRIQKAIAFIAATPYTFIQEG